MTKIEGASARVLHMLARCRKTYAGTRHEWRGVVRESFTRATAEKLLRLGLIETRTGEHSWLYTYEARATLAGCVAAENLT